MVCSVAAAPACAGCADVVQAQLGHLQVIIRQVAPEEILDLRARRGIIIALKGRGHPLDQPRAAGQDPAVGWGVAHPLQAGAGAAAMNGSAKRATFHSLVTSFVPTGTSPR